MNRRTKAQYCPTPRCNKTTVWMLSRALENTFATEYNGKNVKGACMGRVGRPAMVQVEKCTNCGRSRKI